VVLVKGINSKNSITKWATETTPKEVGLYKHFKFYFQMKKLLMLLMAIGFVAVSFAQTTNRINYQAVARNSNGTPVPNGTNISLRISLLDAAGNVAYSETKAATTNQQGLFSYNIGDGTPAGTYDYNNVDWTTKKNLKVEIDPAGGLNFQLVSNEELKAVPIANAARSLVLPIDQTADNGGGASALTIRSNKADGLAGVTNSPTNTGTIGYTFAEGGNGVAGIATKAAGRGGLFLNTASNTKAFFAEKDYSAYFEHPSGTWAKFGMKSPLAAALNGGMDINNGYLYVYTSPTNPKDHVLLNGGGGNSAIELKAGLTYIDFGYDNDFNMRLSNAGTGDKTNILTLDGGMLHVRNSRDNDNGSYAYLNGGNNTGKGSGTVPTSIKAEQRVSASEINVYSDNRIKNIVGVSDKNKDFEMLGKLEVTDYTHKDVVMKGTASKKGFIAQQVETIFPEAVSKSKDFIPNIYTMSQKCVVDATAKTLQVTMVNVHGLKVGDNVRFFLEKTQKDGIVSEVTANTFVVKDWTEKADDKIFVFGKEVSDFRTVDYDRIFTLNVSATQELIKRNQTLEQRVADLEKQNKSLEKNVESLDGKMGAILKKLEENTTSASVGNVIVNQTQK
jgi:Myelin regulatory factor ICA domain/Chaperone of endosialidase